MVKDWLPPSATLTAPLGLIVPPAPLEAVMVWAPLPKLALMLCGDCPLVNVWVLSGPTEPP